jgi:Na+/melibiose symporter-like transporter
LFLQKQNPPSKNKKTIMEDLTRTTIEQAFWIIVIIIILVAIVAILFVFFSKKKHCSLCGEKTRNKDGLCEPCTNEHLLQKARINSPQMLCHIHGKTMDPRIVLGIQNVVVHTCPNPICTLMVIDRKDLSKLTLLDLDLYPPDPEEKETS